MPGIDLWTRQLHRAGDHGCQLHLLELEHDLPGADASDVEEIVDQAHEMMQLPLHQSPRTRQDRWIGSAQSEQLHGILQRCERISQLVSQDRQELVLTPIGRGELFGLAGQPFLAHAKSRVIGAAPAFRAIALRGSSTQKESGDRDDGHEQGHLQETALHRWGDERTAAVESCDDGHDDGAQNKSGRALLPQAQSRPDDRREDQIVHGVCTGRAVSDEHGETQNEHRQHQQGCLREALEAPAAPRLIHPHEQERCSDQITHCIADPPRGPQRAERAPLRHTRGAQARDADGGTDQCAQARREKKQRGHVVQSFQARLKSDAQQKRRPYHSLQGIANGDAGGGKRRSAGGHVRREGGERNGRPQPASTQNERCERHAGAEPDD